jgi:hypothetical protein
MDVAFNSERDARPAIGGHKESFDACGRGNCMWFQETFTNFGIPS